jgi:hypothetical protein
VSDKQRRRAAKDQAKCNVYFLTGPYWPGPGPPNDNERKHGLVYTTSMAVLALAVDRHVLPAYQR